MTEEYNFFKQFAGVTESDLEALRCGGKMKKKAQDGVKLPKKKSKTYQDYVKEYKTPDAGEKFLERMKIVKQESELKLDTKRLQKALAEEKLKHPERFDSKGSRKYNKKDDKASLGGDQWNPKKKK